jgi:leucyl aminopeptidase
MTDFASLLVADRGQPAHPIHLATRADFADWLKLQPARARTAVGAARFEGKAGSLAILPGDSEEQWSVALGVPEKIGPWDLASAAAALPEGAYRLADGASPGTGALGWLLAQHRFDRYLSDPEAIPARVLISGDAAQIDETVRIAAATALVRDLVDTPSADLGPAELADAARSIAEANDATFEVTLGDALESGYPMIAAVGRAAVRSRSPRLIEMHWGNPKHPRVALIGKGVVFDSGGLDLKPSSAMLWMKKDMGGAAHALALASLVMQARLPVRLHLLIPAAENVVAGDAFRPGDILRSRKGLSVEIGNTDAEGRLILADALTRAVEEEPELIIDFATLTGAARVALGPDLPALFTNQDELGEEFRAAADLWDDPVWRLPLWAPYADMLKSTIADLNNAGEGGMAGAITAALFLEKFVPPSIAWAHLDTFAWRPAAKPGRPKGGDSLSMRAAYFVLKRRFS